VIECKLNIQLEGFKLEAKFTIPDKGITVVFGPSGSGKTTLLRAIAGLEKGDTGFLKVGDSIWQSDHNFVPTHKRQIGYVFQDAALFDHLNVEGNLNYVIKRKTGLTKDFIDSIYTLLDIKPLINRSTVQLSGGEKQRVAIARSIVNKPKILFADEPTGNLDKKSSSSITDLIFSLNELIQTTLVLVTHDLSLAEKCDEVYELSEGQLL